ncbi:MAG: type IV-A pilus assembly ATPase PilB [Deltaproteobacteria bacterium]|jgi:type IV pilus assembly protein PilB|nr:type IV-A pilus assembly ATPase PilB [Deltaproteobacteria bacterium]
MPEKLGRLLLNNKIISGPQLQEAIKEQKGSGERLGSVLVKLGFIKEDTLVSFLSGQYGTPFINLSEFSINSDLIKLIPCDIAHKYLVFPLSLRATTLVIAMADPSNIFAIDDIKFLTGYRIEVLAATESAIKEALNKYYDTSSNLSELVSHLDGEGVEFIEEGDEIDISELKYASEEAPVIKLVNGMLNDAIKKGASDIHVESYDKTFRVRFRIDGVLYDAMNPSLKFKNAFISRLKIMSKLDIAERRLPQDGRIKIKTERNREVDFRVSVLPTLFGEKVVLRLLDKSSLQLDMTKLGFEKDDLENFQKGITQPFGMVLVTGPTGSGKTTTLYSAISELNEISKNISTAENPVEYNLMGINQVQIHEGIGLTFANTLRAFLRQDPDIILVGEIRDFETAEIAIKAALTGHLVLSTLHTNDAPSTVNRLLNMGIEPFLIASSVTLILAQRLVRKVCSECRIPTTLSEQAFIDLGVKPEEFQNIHLYKGTGCKNCNHTGFKGRIAVYEVMPLNANLKELILKGASSTDLKKEAMKCGMSTLRSSAINKMKQGLTTVEDVLRITCAN